MKLNHKIDIDLKAFILNGKFDYVEIGQTQEWLAQNFADPDDQADMGNQIDIWRFGSIEFHFFENKLFLIWCDDLTNLSTAKGLKIKTWIFKDRKELNFVKVLKILNKFEKNYSVKFNSKLNNIQLKLIDSQIVLHFEPKKESHIANKFKLIAFGLSCDSFERDF